MTSQMRFKAKRQLYRSMSARIVTLSPSAQMLHRWSKIRQRYDKVIRVIRMRIR